MIPCGHLIAPFSGRLATDPASSTLVIAGLDPAIHLLLRKKRSYGS